MRAGGSITLRVPRQQGVEGSAMGWMDLVDDPRVFLIRLTPDLWEEIQQGTLKSVDLLCSRRTDRVPEFRYGDVLLLYHPELPDRPPPELSHVATVRSELSND